LVRVPVEGRTQLVHSALYDIRRSRYHVATVSNGSNFPVWFWVRFRPRTQPLHHVSTQNLLLKSQHYLLQSSIGVLIVWRHNLYVKQTVWCPLPCSSLQFEMWSIIVVLRRKPGHFGVFFGSISHRLDEY
jgi:hypothetical protein